LEVLYEDNHLLAINKPAMLPTMGVAADRPSLLTEAKSYLKRKYRKPGNVYLGVVSRLDAPVTGVVLMARTSKAADRLNRQFRERSVKKIYWAVVEGIPDPAKGSCCDWLLKDERHRRVRIVPGPVAGAQEARLRFRTILDLPHDLCLLEVQLETGRKHQIRVQLAGLGHAVCGDRKYGGRRSFPLGVALHARKLGFTHPVRDESLELEAPLPTSWRGILPEPPNLSG
jgi:23S rRNA pseudouridine1911/1915/1917 synthase